MWDQDQKSKPKKPKNLLEPGIRQSPPTPILASEEEIFRHYATASVQFREACGIELKAGKIRVTNQKALDRLMGWQKDILREVCLKLAREFNNTEVPHFWRKP